MIRKVLKIVAIPSTTGMHQDSRVSIYITAYTLSFYFETTKIKYFFKLSNNGKIESKNWILNKKLVDAIKDCNRFLPVFFCTQDFGLVWNKQQTISLLTVLYQFHQLNLTCLAKIFQIRNKIICFKTSLDAFILYHTTFNFLYMKRSRLVISPVIGSVDRLICSPCNLAPI